MTFPLPNLGFPPYPLNPSKPTRVKDLEQALDEENQAANEREESWMELQTDWEALEKDMEKEIET